MPRRLFHDEFAELPVGPLPTDFSAIGEYHYAPPAGEMGRWYEPVRGGWGPHAPWVVLEDGGRHRLLQVHQGAAQRGPRLLVAGQSDWADYTLTVRLQPLRTDGWAGVVFRYETGRCHCRCVLDGGRRLLPLRVRHEGQHVLGEVELAYDGHAPLELSVTLAGQRIAASLDGRAVLTAEDGACPAGRIGLAASCPAIYDSVDVTAGEAAAAAFVWTRDRRLRELDELRRRQPRPVLWRQIPTGGFGTGRQIRFGHLRGRGEPDIVLAQNLKLLPASDNLTTVRCLTALDLEGNVLWHFAQPYDLNGDGRDELYIGYALLDGDGGLIDGRGRRVVLVPDDGHGELCCEAIDLTGDARDEIVCCDRRGLWIYTQDRPFDGRAEDIYRPRRYPHHNASNYRAEISLPPDGP